MNTNYLRSIVVAACVLSPVALQAQNYYDLDFSNPVQATNAHDSLGNYYTGNTTDFTNVAPTSGKSVDLRARVTKTAGNYSFVGTYPDYGSVTGEPSGDLGYRYQADGYGVGGITYNLGFYQGGGTFSNQLVVNDFRLMIYDVDGESWQSESVRVNTSDGFYGYQLPTSGGVTVRNEGNGNFLFTGPGVDRSETDSSGAFILYFRNTSSINLQMESNTYATVGGKAGPLPNPVFSAIDGDLSMLDGNTTSFGNVNVVPEPSIALLGLGSIIFFLRRKR